MFLQKNCTGGGGGGSILTISQSFASNKNAFKEWSRSFTEDFNQAGSTAWQSLEIFSALLF